MQALLEKFKENHPDKTLLFFYVAGSHFFDLNTENSDKDYRGVYITNSGIESKKGELNFSSNKTNTKNNSSDVDCNLYSLEKFLNLLKTGDFNMIEMLFTPKDKTIVTSPIFEEIRSIRESIIINDYSAFIGFIKKESKRYGVNSNHFGFLSKFLAFLSKYDQMAILKDIWQDIIEYSKDESNGVRLTASRIHSGDTYLAMPALVIAMRMYQASVRVEYVVREIKSVLENFGHRRREQAKHEGVEFKGLYHAQRLIFEAIELYETGKLTIPFNKEKHEYLMSIKTGQISSDVLFERIDYGIETVQSFKPKSNIDSVHSIIDKLLFYIYGQQKILIKGNLC